MCICAQFVCSKAADFSLNFPNRYRIVQKEDLLCHERVLPMTCDVHNSKQFYCCDNLKWFLNSFFSIDCRFTMPNLFNLMNFLHVYIFIILYNLFRCEYRTWCFSGILNFSLFVWYLIRESLVLWTWIRSIHVCLKWDQRLIFRFITEFMNNS